MLMSTDIPQVPKNDYEELKCKYCLKVIGWGKCTCDQSAKGMLESICAECYLHKIVNSSQA
jgi:hypothetical protein